MTKRMLIDATHPEETRVVVLDGARLEEFDVETSTKQQNKGNIYLARIVRVEPSLQAAFVDYGAGRHGFLAFSEIHPDYYQISEADRAKLIAEQEEQARAEALEADDADESESPDGETNNDATDGVNDDTVETPETGSDDETTVGSEETDDAGQAEGSDTDNDADNNIGEVDETSESADAIDGEAVNAEDDDAETDAEADTEVDGEADVETDGEAVSDETATGTDTETDSRPRRGRTRRRARAANTASAPKTRAPARSPARIYKIQDVIKRRQIVLVQVVKEERGNKGAALTTYLSLAGRYCVFVPNTTRGGGVSRKITNAADRKRLKTIMSELVGPKGSAIILRTAGSERSKAEIKRDHDYLLRTWETIREASLNARAPCLIHEEGSLIKRAIRDIYSRDIEEVLVEGDAGYRAAKDFMRMLTPSHARRVQPYKDESMPLFHRFQVENQMDAMLQPVAQLKSGGYLVISQTEALVAIDVNSGRSTRERNIDDTAYKTNLEAADEIARQLRLRDLAGLIVIDFIDMDDPKANAAVEKRLKDALKSDRARIQTGHISQFGLMEMSRQRLRPSLMETSFRVCNHCKGTGLVRSVESTALSMLRLVEEDGIRMKYCEITLTVPTEVALYILNRKRDALLDIEQKYSLRVYVEGDDSLMIPEFRVDRTKGEPVRATEEPHLMVAADFSGALTPTADSAPAPIEADDDLEPEDVASDTTDGTDTAEGSDNDNQNGNRKRRRRRRRRRGDGIETIDTETNGDDASDVADDVGENTADDSGEDTPDEADEPASDEETVSDVTAEDIDADDETDQIADAESEQPDTSAEPDEASDETSDEPAKPAARRRIGWWSRK